jgi:cell division protein FtsI/penicillin-binding protein 2
MQKAMIGVTTNPRGTTINRFASFDYYIVDDGQIVSGRQLSAAQRKAARRLIVAGKSGTAQAPGNQLPFAWFTAYAPADDPQIAVTVLFENAGQGSAQAAPVVRQIVEAYFGLPISPTPKDALETD